MNRDRLINRIGAKDLFYLNDLPEILDCVHPVPLALQPIVELDVPIESKKFFNRFSILKFIP